MCLIKVNAKGPLQLAEAENAVEIARLAGAEKYAADTFQKAKIDLQNAEGFLHGGKNRKESETNAREAAQMAEDARIITYRKIREEELANERAAAAQREADEKAKAAQSALEAQQSAEQARLEAERRARAEADTAAAEKAKAEALQAQQAAQLATKQAQQERAAADAARAAAIQQQQALAAEADRANKAAQQAEAMRQQAEAEKDCVARTPAQPVEYDPGDTRNAARLNREH